MFRSSRLGAHPVLQGLTGLTPLLAVTTRLVDALIFGLVLTLLLLLAGAVTALVRDWIAPPVRLLAVLIVSAGGVSICDILAGAWLHDWHAAVGMYLPLIATSCLVLEWLETDAMRRSLPAVLGGALGRGLAVAWLLAAFGLVRELLGRGSLLAGLETLPATVDVAPLVFGGPLLPLMAQPAGGLLLLGVVFAGYAYLGLRHGRGEVTA